MTHTAEFLHRPALSAIVAVATSPMWWASQSQLCGDAGITPSTLSMAIKGDRGLSDAAVTALLGVLPDEVTREAFILPVRARPGDLETTRIVAELKRKQDSDSAFYRDVLVALNERKG